jgi:hypothetical protein
MAPIKESQVKNESLAPPATRKKTKLAGSFIATLLATLLAVFGNGAAAIADSTASSPCGGTTITNPYASHLWAWNGVNAHKLHLTYNSSSQKNCAADLHMNSAIGKPRVTSIWLWQCKVDKPNTNCEPKGAAQKDPPNDASTEYSQYAGPVYLKAPGHCIAEQFRMAWPDRDSPLRGRVTPAANCG